MEYIDVNEIKNKTILLDQLIYLRNKVTAHRREDDPRKEDIEELSSGMNHFGLKGTMGSDAKKNIALRYQLISKIAKNGYVDFVLQTDHLFIVEEILYCVEQFFINLKNKTN